VVNPGRNDHGCHSDGAALEAAERQDFAYPALLVFDSGFDHNMVTKE
jgi:hypothetical protein